LLLVALLARPAVAGPASLEFPPDRIFEQIRANRQAYGKVVFIFGDSVSMMCSLEPIDFSTLHARRNDTQYMVSAMAEMMRAVNEPGEKVKDPLWCMHSMAAAINALLGASGLLQASDHGQVIPEAKLVATYAGELGQPQPKNVAANAARLTELVDTGVIRDGDVVVFEDAGYNGQNPDVYETNWLALGRAVLPRVNVTLVMYDMFDNIPEEEVMGIPPDAFRFDVPFPSPATGGKRSHNQALRDAVAKLAAMPDNKGHLLFIDMRRRMDAFRAALREALGTPALMPEGIHPNAWGEAFVVRELLRETGIAGQLTNTAPYRGLLVANASRLALDGKPVDQDKAGAFIDAWLIP
jgi:hypothetical protein